MQSKLRKIFTWTRIKGNDTPPLGAFPELYSCSFRCIRFWRPMNLIGQDKSVKNTNECSKEENASVHVSSLKFKPYECSYSHLFLQFLQIGSFLFNPISQSKTLSLIIFKELEKIMLDLKSQKVTSVDTQEKHTPLILQYHWG
jgi:hypothetical protein